MSQSTIGNGCVGISLPNYIRQGQYSQSENYITKDDHTGLRGLVGGSMSGCVFSGPASTTANGMGLPSIDKSGVNEHQLIDFSELSVTFVQCHHLIRGNLL